MPWINEIDKPFLRSRWVLRDIQICHSYLRIAIREADVSGGGLPEVHRLGSVVVDC